MEVRQPRAALQVVAVQLVASNPYHYDQFNHWRRWPNRKDLGDADWNVVNIVEGRYKASSRASVWYAVGRPNPGVVGIACQFTGSDHEVSERSLLFLAQPLADILLYVIDSVY